MPEKISNLTVYAGRHLEAGRVPVFRTNGDGHAIPTLQLDTAIELDGRYHDRNSLIAFGSDGRPFIIPARDAVRNWRFCDRTGNIRRTPVPAGELPANGPVEVADTVNIHYSWDLTSLVRELRRYPVPEDAEMAVWDKIDALQALAVHPGIDGPLPELRDAILQTELSLREYLKDGNPDILAGRRFSVIIGSTSHTEQRRHLLENAEELFRNEGLHDLAVLCGHMQEVTAPAAGQVRQESMYPVMQMENDRILYMTRQTAQMLLDETGKTVSAPDSPGIRNLPGPVGMQVRDRNGMSPVGMLTITRVPGVRQDGKRTSAVLRVGMDDGQSEEISRSRLQAVVNHDPEDPNRMAILEKPQPAPSLWSRMMGFRDRACQKLKAGMNAVGNVFGKAADVLEKANHHAVYARIRHSAIKMAERWTLGADAENQNAERFRELVRAENRLPEGLEPMPAGQGKHVNDTYRDVVYAIDEKCLGTLWNARRDIVHHLFLSMVSLRDYLDSERMTLRLAGTYDGAAPAVATKETMAGDSKAMSPDLEESLEDMVNAAQDMEASSIRNSLMKPFMLNDATDEELKDALERIESVRTYFETDLAHASHLWWHRDTIRNLQSLEAAITLRRQERLEPEALQGTGAGSVDVEINLAVFRKMAEKDSRLSMSDWERCLKDEEGRIDCEKAQAHLLEASKSLGTLCLDKLWQGKYRQSGDLYNYLATEQKRLDAMQEIPRLLSSFSGSEEELRALCSRHMDRLAGTTERVRALAKTTCERMKSFLTPVMVKEKREIRELVNRLYTEGGHPALEGMKEIEATASGRNRLYNIGVACLYGTVLAIPETREAVMAFGSFAGDCIRDGLQHLPGPVVETFRDIAASPVTTEVPPVEQVLDMPLEMADMAVNENWARMMDHVRMGHRSFPMNEFAHKIASALPDIEGIRVSASELQEAILQMGQSDIPYTVQNVIETIRGNRDILSVVNGFLNANGESFSNGISIEHTMQNIQHYIESWEGKTGRPEALLTALDDILVRGSGILSSMEQIRSGYEISQYPNLAEMASGDTFRHLKASIELASELGKGSDYSTINEIMEKSMQFAAQNEAGTVTRILPADIVQTFRDGFAEVIQPLNSFLAANGFEPESLDLHDLREAVQRFHTAIESKDIPGYQNLIAATRDAIEILSRLDDHPTVQQYMNIMKELGSDYNVNEVLKAIRTGHDIDIASVVQEMDSNFKWQLNLGNAMAELARFHGTEDLVIPDASFEKLNALYIDVVRPYIEYLGGNEYQSQDLFHFSDILDMELGRVADSNETWTPLHDAMQNLIDVINNNIEHPADTYHDHVVNITDALQNLGDATREEMQNIMNDTEKAYQYVVIDSAEHQPSIFTDVNASTLLENIVNRSSNVDLSDLVRPANHAVEVAQAGLR